MLAFSNDYYGFIFRVTQSVELFCTYNAFAYSGNAFLKIWYPPNRKIGENNKHQ